MVFEGLNCRHFHETTTSIDTDFLPVHSCLDPSKVKNVHEFRKQAVPCLFLLVQKFIRILRWSRADVNQLNTQLKIKYLLPSALSQPFHLNFPGVVFSSTVNQFILIMSPYALLIFWFLPKLIAKLFTSLLWLHLSVKNFKLRWVFLRGVVVNVSPAHNRSFRNWRQPSMFTFLMCFSNY